MASSSLSSSYLKNFTSLKIDGVGNLNLSDSSDDNDDEYIQPVETLSCFVIDKAPSVKKLDQARPEVENQKSEQFKKRKPSAEKEQASIHRSVLSHTKVEPESNLIKNIAQKIASNDDILEKSILKPGFEQQHAVPPYTEARRKLKRDRKMERAKSKGPQWYNLPATEMTEEKKNDLMVLQMRNILDPKHFYKKSDLKALPKYFQVGTIVESPADFYSSRIPKKDRKPTIVDELLADAEFRKYNKKKYMEVVSKQPGGLRRAYKHMKRLKKNKK